LLNEMASALDHNTLTQQRTARRIRISNAFATASFGKVVEPGYRESDQLKF